MPAVSCGAIDFTEVANRLGHGMGTALRRDIASRPAYVEGGPPTVSVSLEGGKSSATVDFKLDRFETSSPGSSGDIEEHATLTIDALEGTIRADHVTALRGVGEAPKPLSPERALAPSERAYFARAFASCAQRTDEQRALGGAAGVLAKPVRARQ